MVIAITQSTRGPNNAIVTLLEVKFLVTLGITVEQAKRKLPLFLMNEVSLIGDNKQC